MFKIAYESLGDHSQATQCYRRAGLWQEALFTAAQVPYSAEDLEELSLSLAEALYESKDYQSTATIHMDHRSDLEEAAKVLCKGCYFSEAMRLVGDTLIHILVSTNKIADQQTRQTGASSHCGRCWLGRRLCTNLRVDSRMQETAKGTTRSYTRATYKERRKSLQVSPLPIFEILN